MMYKGQSPSSFWHSAALKKKKKTFVTAQLMLNAGTGLGYEGTGGHRLSAQKGL